MRNFEREMAAGKRANRQGLAAVIQEMAWGKGVKRQHVGGTRAIVSSPLARPNDDAIENRQRTLLQQNDDPAIAQVRLERILQGNELTDINYLAQGLSCARSVCRIVLRSQKRLIGYGTGFLVAPGVLLTNHHVLSSVELVSEAIAQFRYERTISGAEANARRVRFRDHSPSPIAEQGPSISHSLPLAPQRPSASLPHRLDQTL